jgi:GNAT superfamily N-acetyltransferase
MEWTPEAKLRAAIEAPTEGMLLRPDTRVIRRPGWYQVVTPSAPGSMLNEILLSDIAPEETERAIEDAIAAYAAIGRPVKWCVGPWTRPADFGERLLRRGFRSWDVRGMGCHTALEMVSAGAAVVREVGEADLDRYVALSLRGWSLPTDQADVDRRTCLAALRASPPAAAFFAASVGDVWVGTAALAVPDGYGYLLGTQVLEEARGQGVYRALVAARLAWLRERGIGYAVTHAREATSAPMLAHMGYETLFRSKCYVLDVAA